jgi:hypothetical protein
MNDIYANDPTKWTAQGPSAAGIPKTHGPLEKIDVIPGILAVPTLDEDGEKIQIAKKILFRVLRSLPLTDDATPWPSRETASAVIDTQTHRPRILDWIPMRWVARFPWYPTAQTDGDHSGTVMPTLLDNRRRIAPLRPSAKRPRGEFFYFVLGGMEDSCADAQCKSDSGGFEVQSISFQVDRVLETAVGY